MGSKKRKNPKPDKKPLTAAQKRRKREAKAERQKKYKWIFINGKQVRIKRPETFDGMDEEEFIRRNACDIWLTQNGRYDILDERYRDKEPVPEIEQPEVATDDDECWDLFH